MYIIFDDVVYEANKDKRTVKYTKESNHINVLKIQGVL